MRPCNCPKSQLVCGTTRTQILQWFVISWKHIETTWPGFLCPDLVSISWHGVINYFFCTFTPKSVQARRLTPFPAPRPRVTLMDSSDTMQNSGVLPPLPLQPLRVSEFTEHPIH